MQSRAISKLEVETSIDQAAAKVEVQKALIATMRFDDPRLGGSFALLRQLQHDLTIAELDCVFVRHGNKRSSLSA